MAEQPLERADKIAVVTSIDGWKTSDMGIGCMIQAIRTWMIDHGHSGDNFSVEVNCTDDPKHGSILTFSAAPGVKVAT